ncbi:MAG: hypothetical protein AB9836_04825 [Aminipila sp.]
MKLRVREPKTTEYCFRLDKNDDLYINCTWARFLLNHDTYVLSIESDCGSFSYGWSVTESEPFKTLMARIDKWYLMEKISSMNVLNLEESKRKTIENIKESFAFEQVPISQQEYLVDEINDIESNTEEGFYRAVDTALYSGISSENIETEMDYPLRAQVICNFFEKYLQPELRKQQN